MSGLKKMSVCVVCVTLQAGLSQLLKGDVLQCSENVFWSVCLCAYRSVCEAVCVEVYMCGLLKPKRCRNNKRPRSAVPS